MKPWHSFIPRFLGLSLLLIAVGARADAYPVGQADAQSLDNGLVAYYSFSGNANDGSGNGYHGVVNGATLTLDRLGNPQGAYSFDGIDDFIETPLNFATGWEVGDPIHFSLWVKTTTDENGCALSGKPGDGPDFYALVWDDAGSGKMRVRLYGGAYAYSDIVVNDGVWHCVDWGTDGTDSYFYVDGVAQSSAPSIGSFNRETSLVFGVVRESDYLFDGAVDEVRVYNRALSESEIQDLCDIENVYLPLVVHNYTDFPLYIGNAIPAREANYVSEIFYTTSLYIPSTLPSGGHFYLSSQPNTATEVLVDDEIAIMSEGVDVWTCDFSTSGLPQPAVPEISRSVMEQLAGQMATIEYRDVYGSFVQASTVWLIWMP